MIRWLQDNPVGVGLASLCGFLVLVVVLLVVVWTLPPSGTDVTAGDGDTVASLDLPELQDAGKLEDYEEIITRPVFNESRQPIIEVEEEVDEDVGEEDLEGEVDAPDVELAGVIITPSLRMATLKERGESASLVAFVGRPLEGPYGTWQVTRIEPREVTLASAEGEELQLKLQVHNATMAQPPKSPGSTADADRDGEPDADQTAEEAEATEQSLSRAEEIRQRIAERREELRRAAESEQEDGGAPVSYQQAIQNMMGRKPRDRSGEDPEQ